MIATYFQSTKNPFVFCTTLPTHKHSAKQQNRFSHPLSREQRLGFIAQTFTILFAMYKPVDWQRLPLYPGDILGFSFPSKGFSAAYWRGGYMTDKFHFVPTTIMALLFLWGWFLQAFVRKKGCKWENKLIACYTKPNQQDTCQCLVCFFLLLSKQC